MEQTSRPSTPCSTSLFQVYLRLKPPTAAQFSFAPANSLYPVLPTSERYVTVEDPDDTTDHGMPTHITITPPHESRRRAVEKFAFTKVFQEDAGQLSLFRGTGVLNLLEGVLGSAGSRGRDGLLATLGVTGSGKSHTILGTKSQRGLTQLSLDVLFRSLGGRLVQPSSDVSLQPSLAASDSSEAQVMLISTLMSTVYGIGQPGTGSRAATPMPVQEVPMTPGGAHRHKVPQVSSLPQVPDVRDINLTVDEDAEYAVLIFMYEVYNDRIFDLLTNNTASTTTSSRMASSKDLRRRPLLFKPTEQSPDRKVVAGLRKVICGSMEDAMMVLETGLTERRVAGTGSNSTSSRSHGFFCVEVKKRSLASSSASWSGSTFTIVDLAGSERARNAKTAGATLAEGGKINESLMYLGQCLQMQSDSHDGGNKASIVPFRQCKLTELLFSNSFPQSASSQLRTTSHRNPQKAIMIVTADPLGDFNSTSQILRYSALAREVTVPRIVSTASTILSGTTAAKGGVSTAASGRSTPSSHTAEAFEAVTLEIEKLSQEVDVLTFRLAEEEQRRKEAEAAWSVAEERCQLVEQQIREECGAELERVTVEEQRRWKAMWAEEQDRNDAHLDRKIDLVAQSIQIHEDAPSTESERVQELEQQNAALHRQIELLQRDLQGRSPTRGKKGGLAVSKNANANASLGMGMAVGGGAEEEATDTEVPRLMMKNLKLSDSSWGEPLGSLAKSPAKTPGKKMRKLTTRKWDLEPVENLSP